MTGCTHALASNDDSLNPMPTQLSPVASVAELRQQLPLSAVVQAQVRQHRQAIRRCLSGDDRRLLVIVGPCSLHDDSAALEYGNKLRALSEQLQDQLLIVMRTYVEKPRTRVGWKGLAYDPLRDGLGNMELGLTRSRRLMRQLLELGLPLANEVLNPLVSPYFEDLISWAAIGARTAESQPHRELVSGLPLPVGIKNSTDGSVDNAINAMVAARHPHHTLGINDEGQLAMATTAGNADTHLVLRGGYGLTNYDTDSIIHAAQTAEAALCSARVLVDCSHANAEKQHRRQMDIARQVVAQRQQAPVVGIMLESFLVEGGCDYGSVYGQSITDPCLGWEQTETLLRELHQQLLATTTEKSLLAC
jgi:3-deoxy-7-phosphoheptulonate synthase